MRDVVMHHPGYARASRLPLVVVMIVSVLAAGFLRAAATDFQETRRGGQSGARGASALGSMNSFALALLLGGLRGPLAMVLWATSESQKADRNLEDFDTKVELIRLLQPEFDTVHLFQIWNKAYNISAQLPSLPHKYAVILDAIDYAKNVDAERPNNMNILGAIGALYSDKLGGAVGDKEYYIRRIREDTRYRPAPAGPRRPGATRQRHDSILEPDGMLRPGLVRPLRPRPDSLTARIVGPPDLLPGLKAAAPQAGIRLPEVPEGSGNARQVVLTVPQADADKLKALYYPADARYVDAD